jgi:hypothetical protein
MIKHNQDGAVNGVVISLVLSVFLLMAAIGFGGWAFASRQDYKNNSDAKAADAAAAAVKEAGRKKDLVFAESYKNPLKTYVAPEANGSIQIQFPKTWSGYVTTADSSQPLDGYFAPGVVPAVNNDTYSFALRAQLVSQAYSDVLNSFSSQQKDGEVTVSAFAFPKLPKVVGVRVVGNISEKKKVDMIVVPLRSDTLKIWTEGDQYQNDFNKYIIPNLTFSP